MNIIDPLFSDMSLNDVSFNCYVPPVIPLIYNNMVDTSTITQLLLIDSIVADAQLFFDSANLNTFPIIYSYSSTVDEFVKLLNDNFTNLERICFVFHDSASGKLFLDNQILFTEDDLFATTFSPNTQLIINTIRKFKVALIDFLACDSLTHPNWAQFYNLLNTQTGVIVGASNDRTGNLAYGGDWLMENTNENVLNTYFNNNILNYASTLANNISASGTIQIKQSGANIQYSVDAGSNWANVVWPTSIINASADPSNNRLTVLFTTDLTISSTSNYFITGSQGITYDGNNKTVMVAVDNFVGLIQNGSNLGAIIAYSNTTVQNIITKNNGSIYTLSRIAASAYICQYYFGYNVTNTLINNCTNYGFITAGGSGICSGLFGLASVISNCTNHGFIDCANDYGSIGIGGFFSSGGLITNCTNYGQICGGTRSITWGNGFGICYANSYPGTCTITNCTNYGNIYGANCVGIGAYSYGATITNCANYGDIYGSSSGGICGLIGNTNNTNTYIRVINCINVGTIIGQYSGGIGRSWCNGYMSFTNCINKGNITGANSGGICGDTNRAAITGCYSSGNITSVTSGGICGSNAGGAITNCIVYYTTNLGFPYYNTASPYVTLTHSYSSSIAAWSDISANAVLVGYAAGVGSPGETWSSNSANTPYVLTNYQSVAIKPTITTMTTIPNKTLGMAPFLITDPSSNSTGAFSYYSSNIDIASVSGNTITMVGAGTVTITAIQASTPNYTIALTSTSFVISRGGPTITWTIPSVILGTTPFTVPLPTSNSTGAFTYSTTSLYNASVASLSGSTITVVGVGTSLIRATQLETTNYVSGTVVQYVTVTKGPQTITFTQPLTKVITDASFALIATSSSGLSITYSSSNTSVASISGDTITIKGLGDSVITASQAGNASYLEATSVLKTLTVSKVPQTISFDQPLTKVITDVSFALIATCSSGLNITYSSSNLSVATISNNIVTINKHGSTLITSNQAGNTTYLPATSVSQILTITKILQTISFAEIPPKTHTDLPFSPNATSSSGLPVSYSSSNQQVAIISSNMVNIKGIGDSVITASQGGDDIFSTAPDVSQTLISNICFLKGTPITTNQGDIPIERIDPEIHTIRNKKVVLITKTITQDKHLICFEKNALGNNIPSQKTIISKNHMIFYKGQMTKAYEFIEIIDNVHKVHKVKYDGDILYNVLMEEYDKMMVNNIICETLNPDNFVAIFNKILCKSTPEKQSELIKIFNDKIIKDDIYGFNKKLPTNNTTMTI